jgi:hypothetical protein
VSGGQKKFCQAGRKMTYFRGQYHKIIRLRPEKGGILCVRIVYRTDYR